MKSMRCDDDVMVDGETTVTLPDDVWIKVLVEVLEKTYADDFDDSFSINYRSQLMTYVRLKRVSRKWNGYVTGALQLVRCTSSPLLYEWIDKGITSATTLASMMPSVQCFLFGDYSLRNVFIDHYARKLTNLTTLHCIGRVPECIEALSSSLTTLSLSDVVRHLNDVSLSTLSATLTSLHIYGRVEGFTIKGIASLKLLKSLSLVDTKIGHTRLDITNLHLLADHLTHLDLRVRCYDQAQQAFSTIRTTALSPNYISMVANVKSLTKLVSLTLNIYDVMYVQLLSFENDENTGQRREIYRDPSKDEATRKEAMVELGDYVRQELPSVQVTILDHAKRSFEHFHGM
jgi:ribosomal protein S17E